MWMLGLQTVKQGKGMRMRMVDSAIKLTLLLNPHKDYINISHFSLPAFQFHMETTIKKVPFNQNANVDNVCNIYTLILGTGKVVSEKINLCYRIQDFIDYIS